MKRLIQNELLRIKYSRRIFIFLVFSLLFVIMDGSFPVQYRYRMTEYGYMAAIWYLRMTATVVFAFMAPVAAELVTREFRDGTIHNALSCGISRKKYFCVKTSCYFCICTVHLLGSLIVYFILRCIIAGYNPMHFSYPDYGLVNLVYLLGEFIILFAYASLYLLFSFIFRQPAVTYLSGLVVITLEATIINGNTSWYGGPLITEIFMYELLEQEKVLTWEFASHLLPCLGLCILFVGLAYKIFLKKDIN